jgi:hypothetical protein
MLLSFTGKHMRKWNHTCKHKKKNKQGRPLGCYSHGSLLSSIWKGTWLQIQSCKQGASLGSWPYAWSIIDTASAWELLQLTRWFCPQTLFCPFVCNNMQFSTNIIIRDASRGEHEHTSDLWSLLRPPPGSPQTYTWRTTPSSSWLSKVAGLFFDLLDLAPNTKVLSQRLHPSPRHYK